MGLKWIAVAALVAALAGGGVAVASHVTQVDPATVPTGFLATHSSIRDVPLTPFVRALTSKGVEVLVQHVRLDPNTPTGWHTHPGPVLVEVASGAVTYEEVMEPWSGGNCRRATYTAGRGFVDRGFGHVHRAVAGPDGADFYAVYLLPPGSTTHVIPAAVPAACST